MGSHKKGKYQEERGGGGRFGPPPFHSFPISHWTDLEAERSQDKQLHSQERKLTGEGAASRKRLSLHSESPGPEQTFHHRYSLPILEPSKGSNLVSINLDNYWDSSKFLLESKDPGDDYLVGSSPPVQYSSVTGHGHGLELASDADLDTRLEVLCL